MSTLTRPCPHCQKYISVDAIACPHCRTPLKALGHKGIPLYQAAAGEVLCDTCLYHQDNTCNYPQRSTAKDCIMYVDLRQAVETPSSPAAHSMSLGQQMRTWINRHLAWIILGAMVIISIGAVLSGG